MSSTNHLSPAVSNSLFYSRTSMSVSCGVVHNTQIYVKPSLRPYRNPLIMYARKQQYKTPEGRQSSLLGARVSLQRQYSGGGTVSEIIVKAGSDCCFSLENFVIFAQSSAALLHQQI